MLFEVSHKTRYSYESAVTYCINETRLTPRTLPNQFVRRTGIHVDPLPNFLRNHVDYFGNDVSSFGVFEKHDHFEASAESLVEVQSTPFDLQSSPSWEEARELLASQADDACLEASEYLYDSPFVSRSLELSEYAKETFNAGRPLLEAAKELSHRIHEEFEYKAASTSIDIPLSEVMRTRRGVCQDFAHVMIGALRSMRLSARYVSGYVRPGPRIQGAQASHAWVSVFIPGSGWLSFDPTNDVIPSDGHVTLAWGRDYGDVTPVKGVTLGGGRQTVTVEVYVKPVVGPAPTN
jgi:transglutaminase-like putative cysteine protease